MNTFDYYYIILRNNFIGMSITKLKLKRKKLFDEYVLTNKHIICKFKYLVVCFDRPDDQSLSGGLINLTKMRLEELFNEQNIQLDSSKEGYYFHNVMTKLKKWHPQICKLEVDCKSVYEIDNLNDYQASWQQIQNHLMELPNNNCIKTNEDFEIFKKKSHKVIDIKVSFQLVKKITKVEEYNVNFNYLHKILIEHLLKWNKTEPAYLDEVTVNINQLPYAEKLKYSSDEDDDICYVYPYMNLIPLHLILN